MNVAGAALIISLILLAVGAAMWVALWAGDRSAPWRASVPSTFRRSRTSR